jgi:hypothetical protein
MSGWCIYIFEGYGKGAQIYIFRFDFLRLNKTTKSKISTAFYIVLLFSPYYYIKNYNSNIIVYIVYSVSCALFASKQTSTHAFVVSFLLFLLVLILQLALGMFRSM